MDNPEPNQMEQQPLLCNNGCGFYSNTGTDGLCSVCFKESIKNKQQDPSKTSSITAAGAMASLSVDESSNEQATLETASPTVVLPASPAGPITAAQTERSNDPGAVPTAILEDEDSSPASPIKEEKKKKKNKCGVCKKKVGLTGFTCRCDGLFCSIHRYSDKHECSYDYKELGAEEIRKNNPVVVSQKVNKI